ncbi:MAG: lysine--tRNA ligase [Pseudomonadota bacterium]
MKNQAALQAKSWAFQEAIALLERYKNAPPEKNYVLFETGYGPSGLPHIGTFGEVARTTMVREAFKQISDIPTRLICFSDDMDGIRKVPDNLPNAEMIAANLGKPLTSVPDPFGTHASFGAQMNAKLCEFLDHFGFDYEFKSSTETYKSGEFDETLLKLLENYQQVMDLMLPTLGEERQQTYSPFLPISPHSGKVLLAKVLETNHKNGTIVYLEEDGSKEEIKVTGGNCKLQWKPDMGMRWAALKVDYEMYGKDHLNSAELYSSICKIAGGTPPNQYCYELFLDEKGQKISKSKGNGITIDEWLRYAPQESLSYYMFQSPRKAKRLYFDVISQQVDDYLTFLEKYEAETDEVKRFDNPVFHIHSGKPPKPETGLKFSLLLHLASVCNPNDKSVLWGFISRYMPEATPETCPFLDRLAAYAVTYYHDFIKPNKKYREPNETERLALKELHDYLINADDKAPDFATITQNKIYEIGKNHPFADLKLWFGALYEILLGQATGPRMGSFIALYGRDATAKLIEKVLEPA